MEFNRSGRHQSPQSAQNTTTSSHSSGVDTPPPAGSGGAASNLSSNNKSSKKKKDGLMNMKNASIALLFSATILVVALIAFLIFTSPRSEARFIEEDNYQAVFLNGGQVYFGKVTHLNTDFVRLVDIYYLRVNQQVQPAEGDDTPILPTDGDISLVKLGCELHGPQDEMLINMDHVIFWENLKPDGPDSQVSAAIAEFKRENPDGQDCGAPGQNEEQPAGLPDVDPLDFDATEPEEGNDGEDEE